MLEEQERKDIVEKAAKRILSNIEAMDGYNKLQAMKKLVNMLDETHLIALDFTIDMTPDRSTQQ